MKLFLRLHMSVHSPQLSHKKKKVRISRTCVSYAAEANTPIKVQPWMIYMLYCMLPRIAL